MSRALLHGIQRVFPLPKVSGHNGQDPISKKKFNSVKVQCLVRKEVLGWMVDGATRCIELARDKKSATDVDLHKILRMKKGCHSKESKIVLEKSDIQQQQSQQEKINDAN